MPTEVCETVSTGQPWLTVVIHKLLVWMRRYRQKLTDAAPHARYMSPWNQLWPQLPAPLHIPGPVTQPWAMATVKRRVSGR